MPLFPMPENFELASHFPGAKVGDVASVAPHPTMPEPGNAPTKSEKIHPMDGDVTAEMDQLGAFLDKQTQTNVMRHFLGHPIADAPPFLEQALIIALDTEWWQDCPSAVTEMGFAELQWWRPDCNAVAPGRPGGHYAHATERLQGIHASHVRIIEYAHLINSFPGAGDPELFFFGHTEFIAGSRVPTLLKDRFRREITPGKYRPIIFIGHDLSHDFQKFKDVFNTDLSSFGTIVKTIDTQILAKEAGIPSPRGPLISLADLLAYFKVTPHNLHTAGNDAAYTLVAAILTSLNEELYPYGPHMNLMDPHVDYAVQRAMQTSQMLPRPRYGCTVFCTRCESYKHRAPQCPMTLCCQFCRTSTSPARRRLWNTHKLERCRVTQHLLEQLG